MFSSFPSLIQTQQQTQKTDVTGASPLSREFFLQRNYLSIKDRFIFGPVAEGNGPKYIFKVKLFANCSRLLCVAL